MKNKKILFLNFSKPIFASIIICDICQIKERTHLIEQPNQLIAQPKMFENRKCEAKNSHIYTFYAIN